jgi:hypothetical protein
MKRYRLLVVAALAIPVSAFAAGKPCEELKAEIAQKLEAKGVTSYSLEIVPKDQEATGKVVGTCEGGTKKIVYDRTTAAAAKKPADPPTNPKH